MPAAHVQFETKAWSERSEEHSRLKASGWGLCLVNIVEVVDVAAGRQLELSFGDPATDFFDSQRIQLGMHSLFSHPAKPCRCSAWHWSDNSHGSIIGHSYAALHHTVGYGGYAASV